MKHDARIAAGDPVDDGRHKARRHTWMASDPDFSSSRVGEKFDFPRALAQVIEYGRSALKHRSTVLGRLDAPGSAVKQTHAHCPFQFRDRSGNGRLSHIEMNGRLVHAAGLGDSRQDTEIVQLHAACNAIADLHFGTYAGLS